MRQRIKKTIIGIILICLISSLGVFVFGINKTQAQYVLGSTVFGNAIKNIVYEGALTIQDIIGKLITIVTSVDQGLLGWANPQKAEIVKTGWGITRDIANMLFVLILLFIALATIFKRSDYSAKELLPKLIIIALLINFSLVIASVVIDAAGVVTDYFLEKSGKNEIFSNFSQAIRLTEIERTTTEKVGVYICAENQKTYPGLTACLSACAVSAVITGGMPICLPTGEKTALAEIDWDKNPFWRVFFALVLTIIFMVIALLVFALLAFLLFIRILVIWFLLIVAPIAWIFYILPATRTYFQNWWNTFIKWVFFAPAAVFFIYLTVTTWTTFLGGSSPELISTIETPGYQDAMKTVMPQVMTASNLLQFFLVCGMLVGSLIVAKEFGIYGAAGTIMAAKSVGKWTGRQLGARPGVAVGTGAMGLAGRGLQRIPGFRTFGQRLQARASLLKKSPLEYPELKRHEAIVGQLSNEGLLRDYRATKGRGLKGLADAREILKRPGLIESEAVDAAEAQQIMNTFRNFGDQETAAKLEERRSDAIDRTTAEGRNRFEQVTQRTADEGTAAKLPPVALRDQALIVRFAELGVDLNRVAEASTNHANVLRETLNNMVTTNGGAQATLPDGTVQTITGDAANNLHYAYAARTGQLGRMTIAQRQNWAREASPDALSRLEPTQAIDFFFARAIPAHKLRPIVEKMRNRDAVRNLLSVIRNNNEADAYRLVNNDPYYEHL